MFEPGEVSISKKAIRGREPGTSGMIVVCSPLIEIESIEASVSVSADGDEAVIPWHVATQVSIRGLGDLSAELRVEPLVREELRCEGTLGLLWWEVVFFTEGPYGLRPIEEFLGCDVPWDAEDVQDCFLGSVEDIRIQEVRIASPDLVVPLAIPAPAAVVRDNLCKRHRNAMFRNNRVKERPIPLGGPADPSGGPVPPLLELCEDTCAVNRCDRAWLAKWKLVDQLRQRSGLTAFVERSAFTLVHRHYRQEEEPRGPRDYSGFRRLVQPLLLSGLASTVPGQHRRQPASGRGQ